MPANEELNLLRSDPPALFLPLKGEAHQGLTHEHRKKAVEGQCWNEGEHAGFHRQRESSEHWAPLPQGTSWRQSEHERHIK